MRKILLGIAATFGVIAFGNVGASATSLSGIGTGIHADQSAIQQADWYCGSRCQYWRHRHWVERHRYWQRGYYPYYGYNGYYNHYYR